MKRPKKLDNLLDVVGKHVENGTFFFTEHALERSQQRHIDQAEIRYVLRNGWHEKRKDSFDEAYQSWSYAVRGKSIDGDRDFRVVVYFDDDGMLIITVIDTTA
jgi:hypothetical protein